MNYIFRGITKLESCKQRFECKLEALSSELIL